MKLPGPDHPISVTPTTGRVQVRIGDRLIVDTTDALTLQESTYPAVQYIPLTAVDPAVLQSSDATSLCPYKGDAGYFDLITEAGTVSDAVWIYRQPNPAVAQIKDHVAFYPQHVTLSVD